MAKPERIRHTGVACCLNGYQLHRVQTVGISTDVTRDETQELANTQIVQYVSQTPRVSITVDTNNYGNTNNLAAAVGATIRYTTVGATADARRGAFHQNLTSTANNSWTITESSLLNAYAELTLGVTEDDTNITRTCWVHRAAMSGLAMSFDQGGLATENYTFEADNKTWYLNGYADVRPFISRNHQVQSFSSSGSYITRIFIAGSADWGATPASLSGSTCVALCVDSNVYRSAADGYTISAVLVTTTTSTRGKFYVKASTSSSTYLVDNANPSSKKVMAMVVPKSAQTWASSTRYNPGYNLTTYSTALGGLARGYIDIWLINTQGPSGSTSAVAGNKTLRLQTANIDVSMATDAQFELGQDKAYGYYRQSPIPVNVTVTANDSDLELWARAAATSVSTVKQIYLDMFTGANQLVVKIYKEKAKTTLLETLTISNMTVTGERHNASVGDLATQEFSFTASNFSLVGSGAS